MTLATSRGMFSGCGVGLISSISGLESIIPVSTSTSPAGCSIVQTNTGQRSPSTSNSAPSSGVIVGGAITNQLLPNVGLPPQGEVIASHQSMPRSLDQLALR